MAFLLKGKSKKSGNNERPIVRTQKNERRGEHMEEARPSRTMLVRGSEPLTLVQNANGYPSSEEEAHSGCDSASDGERSN